MFNTVATIRNKSRAILNQTFGSETQQIISSMLYEDDNEVLTSFEMNRVASLTYGEMVCGEIYDLLEYTIRNPLEFTILSLQKTLVMMHHLAIYASNKAANNTWTLLPHIRQLMEYNTVLLTLEDPSSLLARLQSFMGGNVDHGLPIREASGKLVRLLEDVEGWRRMRSEKKDSLESLVPVGSNEETAFVSDNVMDAMMKDKKKKESMFFRKSNLESETGGFGSGVKTTFGDGKAVGAAHSMEEMLKMAHKTKKRYTDGELTQEEKDYNAYLETLEEEVRQQRFKEENSKQKASVPAPAPPVDLLDFNADVVDNNATADLPFPVANAEPVIDFVSQTQQNVTNTAGTTDDIFGLNTLSPAPVPAPVSHNSSTFISDNMNGTGGTTPALDLLGLSTSTVTSNLSSTNSTTGIMTGDGNNTNKNNMSSLNMMMGTMSMNGVNPTSSSSSSIHIPHPELNRIPSSTSSFPPSSTLAPTDPPSPPDTLSPPPPPPPCEPPLPPQIEDPFSAIPLESSNNNTTINEPLTSPPPPMGGSLQQTEDPFSSIPSDAYTTNTNEHSFSTSPPPMGGTPNIDAPKRFDDNGITPPTLDNVVPTSTMNKPVNMKNDANSYMTNNSGNINMQQQMAMMQNNMMNPMMMMQNMDMSNLSSEQQQQFQQMMLMNQQMMMQMMQMQNTNGGINNSSNGGGVGVQQVQDSDGSNDKNKNYPDSLNPFM